jgi:glycosyltransferase involved in cell wall biosynthesis
MDYFPNIDGALYFANQIFPIIRRSIPEARLRIVGSNPARAVQELGKIPGITITGRVPDVRPYLEEAVVAVAPLRLARGTQNKILEAMAMGVPVVATPQSTKGINAVPSEDLLIGHDAETFASQVINVMQDETLQETLSAAGRQRVTSTHLWPVSMRILEGLLEGCIGEKRAFQWS